MPISVVVGGQFGSEGKGKVAHWLADLQGAKYAVRVGGPNSGHTAVTATKTHVLRQLPTPCLWGGIVSVIPAGAYISVAVLLKEIEALQRTPNNLLIHPNAVIIDDWMIEEELTLGLKARISSTGQGVGSAVSNRVLRNSKVRFAKDHPSISAFVEPKLTSILAGALKRGERIIVEGTQGHGLSNLHGECYPFATSRDTSAAGALSEAGLSPIDVDCIVLVIRSYPIRVADNSGPLPNETNWGSVTSSSGSPDNLVEKTTVTGKIRRIAEFDSAIVRQAIAINNPTHMCMNHADYFDFNAHEKRALTEPVLYRLHEIENSIDRAIDWVGTGPRTVVSPNSSEQLIRTPTSSALRR